MAMTAGFPEEEGAPERIGPYRIRRSIGQGGMGVVYQAVDPHDTPVAIKVLRSEVAGDDIARARLAREVETMRRVHSRNVAEVIDADTSAERPWVVTEYVPGPTLESTVEDHGPLRGRALARFVTGLAQALKDIHAADVIHRDLKPGNVIISNGEPIVIDFGIAHAVDSAKLTQTGTFVGTPSYLSPEVIEGTDLGPATDIHAWGATVSYAATGNPPYGAGAFEAIFFRILNGEIDMDGMPEQLQPIVLRAVVRDMEQRPSAARLVAETGRLNLDLPLEDSEAYHASGLTGAHTVHAERPGGDTTASSAAVPPEQERARPEDPSSTMVAPPGGTDQGRSLSTAEMSTGSPDAGGQDPEGPGTHYFNSTLRGDEFQDLLTPVDYDDRSQDAGDQTAMLDARSREWEPDSYGDGAHDLAEPEGRRLPSLVLIPLLVAAVGLCLMLPTVGSVVGVLAAAVLGALDTVKSEHARRLMTRGPRGTDNVVIALSLPWALLRNLGTALLYGLGYLLGGIVVGLIIGYTIGESAATYVGAYALAVVVLGGFLGPNGAGARRQAGWLAENAVIRNPYVYWGVIAGICLLALSSMVFGLQSQPVWDPIASPGTWFG